MIPLRRLLILLVVCCMCVMTVGSVAASSEYTLQPENEIQTPDRTVTYDGTELTISSIGVVEHEDAIKADISGPNYDLVVQLRSATDPGPLIDSQSREDAGTVSFNTDGTLSPGTYLLLLAYNNYERAAPVVVSGYDMTAEATVQEETEELTISTTATPTASSGDPNEVRAVVWDGETQQNTTLTQQADGDYQGQVSVSKLADDYDVYVTAHGDETLYDSSENEILAISEATIQDDSESGDETTDSGDSDGSDPSTTDPSDQDTTDDGNITDGENVTDDNNRTEGDPVNNSTSGDNSSGDDTSDVIQPNNDSDTGTTSNETNTTDDPLEDETPLSPSVAIIALLSSAVVFAVRS